MEMGSETLGYASGSGDVLNGIKFEEKIYFENVGIVAECSSGAPAITAPFTKKDKSSPKKGRGVTLSSQPPRCQVEGCNVDLTGLKTYYCRHRVCGIHSKLPKVIVGGLEQRFCQQCSRFHLLAEFDQGKRSCRRRLAGHNERRRKPHSSSFVSQTFAHVASILNDDVSRMRAFWDYPYSGFPGQTVWHKSLLVDYAISSENTSEEKFVPSMCQGSFNSSTKAASSNIPTPHFQRTLDWISQPASDSPVSECSAGPVSTSRALSLLSTELHSRKTLSFGLSANTSTISNSWSFRNHESEVSSDNLAIRHLPSTTNSDYFQMNWSL